MFYFNQFRLNISDQEEILTKLIIIYLSLYLFIIHYTVYITLLFFNFLKKHFLTEPNIFSFFHTLAQFLILFIHALSLFQVSFKNHEDMFQTIFRRINTYHLLLSSTITFNPTVFLVMKSQIFLIKNVVLKNCKPWC